MSKGNSTTFEQLPYPKDEKVRADTPNSAFKLLVQVVYTICAEAKRLKHNKRQNNNAKVSSNFLGFEFRFLILLVRLLLVPSSIEVISRLLLIFKFLFPLSIERKRTERKQKPDENEPARLQSKRKFCDQIASFRSCTEFSSLGEFHLSCQTNTTKCSQQSSANYPVVSRPSILPRLD